MNRRRTAGILHLVTGFFLIAKGADYFQYLGFHNFLAVFPVLLVGSCSLFYGLFRNRIDANYQYNFRLRLLQAITFTC